MRRGIGFALGACLIWGLIFVVPEWMEGFSSIEVALGRYFFYGVISLLFFAKSKIQGQSHYPCSIWIKAFSFSLLSTIGYYTFLVLALRYSTPAICALILGISPISIAFYGNWKQKETTFRSLIVPSLLILCGLVIINVPQFEQNSSPSSYIFGLICSFISLAIWSWYVVANARFLKQHPGVRSSDWSTLIGVAAFFWTLVFALALGFFFPNQIQINKYFTLSSDLGRFITGSAILGLLCSWVGTFLWNKASLHLPVSLAGQLTIFETIFGVIFIYLFEQKLPPLMEIIGIVLLLIAITYGIRQFAKRKSYNKELTPH